ncbi:MAG: hypothetical protein V3S66_05270, partial [Desulfobacterales bacterium]
RAVQAKGKHSQSPNQVPLRDHPCNMGAKIGLTPVTGDAKIRCRVREAVQNPAVKKLSGDMKNQRTREL